MNIPHTVAPKPALRVLKVLLLLVPLELLWAGFVALTALQGWYLEPMAPADDQLAFAVAARAIIDKSNAGNTAYLQIADGEVVAEHYVGRDPINEDSYFALASMSKFVTALCVLKLVEEERVDLDMPVSTYLTRWSLPASDYDHDAVTVRRLLSHTAGLADGLGFGDYRADEPLPSLVTELGSPRHSSGEQVAIRVESRPGDGFSYSGGGFLMLELLVEEASGMPFGDYASKAVFEPLGMTRSSYDYLGSLKNSGGSYTRDGVPAELFQYASKGATGLNASAADLGRLVRSLVSAGPHILDVETVGLMRTAHARQFGVDIWGLGTILYAPTSGGDFVFGHDGSNDPAINTALRINPQTRDGIVVLTTGHPSLATRIGFEWTLWQTGYPDPLGLDRAFASMYVPLGIGAIVILSAGVLFAWIRRRPRTASSAPD